MKLFIACASSNDINELYYKDSLELIKELMKNNDLVFGAYNEGLMGECYKYAKQNNRHITGISPLAFKEDLDKLACDNSILTKSINERTEQLITNSDAIVFLPGGIGTIHELLSSIDMKRSNETAVPIIIHNESHYYDELITFLDKLYKEKFSSDIIKKDYYISNSIEETIRLINSISKN